jgi:hypothetical protein
MMEELQLLLVVAFAALALLLRFDAHRFGTAEYDDEELKGGWRGWIRRLAWYSLAIALIFLIYTLFPNPVSLLHLDLGTDRSRALFLGLLYGIGGTALAFLIAWFRYGRFRLPPARLYPGALVNSVATAFIDEALFRGIVMGGFLIWGTPPALAIAAETILYALITRAGAPGRSRMLLLLTIGIGVASGILVFSTLGIGAAVLGHAITRFALFLATGHIGQVRPVGWEPEELAGWAVPPEGWGYVGTSQFQSHVPGATMPPASIPQSSTGAYQITSQAQPSPNGVPATNGLTPWSGAPRIMPQDPAASAPPPPQSTRDVARHGKARPR